MAFSLQVGPDSQFLPANGAQRIVGINPVPFSDPVYWPGSNRAIYSTYVNALADFTLWLVSRGHTLLFFPTQLRLDPPVIQEIQTIMTQKGGQEWQRRTLSFPIASLDDLLAAIANTDVVVATRFHGIVIPFMLHKPVLGIAYHPKTRDLMNLMGQSEYVLDIHDIDLCSLQERFISVSAAQTRIQEELTRRISRFKVALEQQYDHVLQLLEAK